VTSCGLAGPSLAAEVFPGTAILIALGMQDLRTRFSANTRIRRGVKESEVVFRELKVYCTDVVLQLLSLAGSDDDAGVDAAGRI
jgi:pyruvate kinase